MHETSPLLPSGTEDESSGLDHGATSTPVVVVRDRSWVIPVLCGVLILLVDLGDYLCIIPFLRLFELSICRRYYLQHDPALVGRDGNVAEQLCKRDEIQSDLAMLKSWLAVLGGVTGMSIDLN